MHGHLNVRVNSSCRLAIWVGGRASAEIAKHDSNIYETSLLQINASHAPYFFFLVLSLRGSGHYMYHQL